MDNSAGSYAPRSPDLNSLPANPSSSSGLYQQQLHQQQHPSSHLFPPQHYHQANHYGHQLQHSADSFNLPPASTSHYQPPPPPSSHPHHHPQYPPPPPPHHHHHHHHHHQQQQQQQVHQATPPHLHQQGQQQHQQQMQNDPYVVPRSYDPHQYQQSYQPPTSHHPTQRQTPYEQQNWPQQQQQQQQQTQPLHASTYAHSTHQVQPSLPGNSKGSVMPPGASIMHMGPQSQQAERRAPAPGEAEGVVVKTKFPVARIKRIVQADEDVGKVAQVTPVVVSKALELFMISLTLKSAALATSRGSKRVTGAHLKAAVMQDEQFDFLSDIVEKIPDAPAPRERPSAGSDGRAAAGAAARRGSGYPGVDGVAENGNGAEEYHDPGDGGSPEDDFEAAAGAGAGNHNGMSGSSGGAGAAAAAAAAGSTSRPRRSRAAKASVRNYNDGEDDADGDRDADAGVSRIGRRKRKT